MGTFLSAFGEFFSVAPLLEKYSFLMVHRVLEKRLPPVEFNKNLREAKIETECINFTFYIASVLELELTAEALIREYGERVSQTVINRSFYFAQNHYENFLLEFLIKTIAITAYLSW